MEGERPRDVLGAVALWVGDPTLEWGLRGELARAGFEVLCARDEAELSEICQRPQTSVAVVDASRAGTGFVNLCRRLSYALEVAVMAIVPSEDTALRLRAFGAGSCDCLDPKMLPVEIAARVRAVLSQRRANTSKGTLAWGPLSLDLTRLEAYVDGIPLDLTPAEFRVLRALVESRGRVVSRDHLLSRLHADGESDSGSRTVDTHVYSLRKKLGPYGKSIRTVRGTGYCMDVSMGAQGRLPYGLAAQLIYQLASPLLVIDSDMRVIFANEAATSLLGLNRDKLLEGTTCRELLGCTVDGRSPVPECDCFGLKAMALASSNPSATYFVRTNGKPVEVEAVYTYLQPSDTGRYVAILLRPSKRR